MLTITIPAIELYDEGKSIFFTSNPITLTLEHSLVSLSKWESKWLKPLLSKTSKATTEEALDYVRCMTLTQNVDPNVYNMIPDDIMDLITAYIDAPMTATTFPKGNKGPSREIITSEIIYYWMVTFNIPFECQKWHLNRLLTFINVCNVKQGSKKKMSPRELAAQNRSLNESRKAALNTTG